MSIVTRRSAITGLGIALANPPLATPPLASPALAQSADVFRIGLILPMTGPFASTGRQIDAAIRQLVSKAITTEGQVIEGVVKNITDYGALVDLGGIDGLLHVTDMSYKRVNHPSEVLNIGDILRVQIVRINRDTQRISNTSSQVLTTASLTLPTMCMC